MGNEPMKQFDIQHGFNYNQQSCSYFFYVGSTQNWPLELAHWKHSAVRLQGWDFISGRIRYLDIYSPSWPRKGKFGNKRMFKKWVFGAGAGIQDIDSFRGNPLGRSKTLHPKRRQWTCDPLPGHPFWYYPAQNGWRVNAKNPGKKEWAGKYHK